MWTWSMMITHVTTVSKGCSILRGIPLPPGVPHNFLLVPTDAISVPGRSVAFDIFMMSMLVTGATFTRAVSLPPVRAGTLFQIMLVTKLRMDGRVLREWLPRRLAMSMSLGLPTGTYWTMTDGGAMCWRRCTEVECGPVSLPLLTAKVFRSCCWFFVALGVLGGCLLVVFLWLSVSSRRTFALFTHKLWTSGDGGF